MLFSEAGLMPVARINSASQQDWPKETDVGIGRPLDLETCLAHNLSESRERVASAGDG